MARAASGLSQALSVYMRRPTVTPTNERKPGTSSRSCTMVARARADLLDLLIAARLEEGQADRARGGLATADAREATPNVHGPIVDGCTMTSRPRSRGTPPPSK